MKGKAGLALLVPVGLLLAGCLNTVTGANGFITLAEEFGASTLSSASTSQGSGILTSAEETFRESATITVVNGAADEDLVVAMAAWVRRSSITTSAQEDILFRDGYVQTTEELRIGTGIVLPAGTFVLSVVEADGNVRVSGGVDGARLLRIPGGEQLVIDAVTPDAVLFFKAPPESCDSVAFTFEVDGVPVEDVLGPGRFAGSTSTGGRKTLAQIDVYQCDPFRPGLFLKVGGGAPDANEYIEGSSITATFIREGGVDGVFGTIQID